MTLCICDAILLTMTTQLSQSPASNQLLIGRSNNRLTNDLQTELDLLERLIRKLVGGANVEQ